ncbi:hypothetical protein GW793_00115 [bacterium]|uniref:Uncharacterized protein n=2 Tax=Katanobacteria TaxID=422282 RepID=A0A2M7X2D5_UNCKA|nr:hypothetical protein [bacterium]PIP56758.1 MAG: hypothetical protein COX05_01270 [candidate division WWE3 bacterium CG22_combo_CG10-13_8_21_14_all_39_12]PJA40330.1 MAG: hypothetical protein CO179_02550 [candidate division WWE3 bacterium CG_4_9_14_3_um_filter_39_7]
MINKNSLILVLSIVIAGLLMGVSVLWVNYQNVSKKLETTTTSLIMEKADTAKFRNDINQIRACLSLIESGSTDFTINRCQLMLGE